MDMPTALLLGAICGWIGAFAMTSFMSAVSQAYSKRVDMARALGSYFTGKAEGSEGLGRLIHSISGGVAGLLGGLIALGM